VYTTHLCVSSGSFEAFGPVFGARGTALRSGAYCRASCPNASAFRFETKKSLTGYTQLKALQHTAASTFLYAILVKRSPLLGAGRLQDILAVTFQEVLCLLAFVLAAFPLGF
jgi:hypothetical protein